MQERDGEENISISEQDANKMLLRKASYIKCTVNGPLYTSNERVGISCFLERDLFSMCMNELLLFPKLWGFFFLNFNVLQYFWNEMNTKVTDCSRSWCLFVPISYSQARVRCLKCK